MNRISLVLAFLLLCLMLHVPPAFCTESAQALALYQKGKYKEALPMFAKIVKEKPQDINALYYYGLTLHRNGRIAEAKQKYLEVISKFPGSPAAQQAMKIMYPGRSQPQSAVARRGTSIPSRISSRTTGETPSSDYASLPHEAKVYFRREGNALMVDAQLNNRPITMVFDTGAEMCAFGKNHLKELGLPLPQGAPTGMAQGVGDGGAMPTWQMNADLKLGPILRKNLPISVQEYLPDEPLLGQTFFKDFRYTIDNGANSIHFVIKQHASASTVASKSYSPSAATADRYAVPFTLEGNEMIVVAEVNGKPMRMIFDTGASGTVFTYTHLNQLRITIPEDEAEEERHIGIAGETAGVGFPISRLRLGPIDKTNFKISVIQGMSGHPLLGQSFYGDWQYSIDNANKMIHFLRR